MPKRILIAEDEQDARELLTSLATAHGYDVRAVADGSALLSVVVKERFDIIITDISMPFLNGASATEIIKMAGETIPVIAITALGNNEIEMVKDTFVRVFCKPIDTNELFHYVEKLIGH